MLGQAMEHRSLGPKGKNFYKTTYLKEKYADDIEKSRTFKPKGVSEKDALKYIKTKDGQKYIDKLQEASPLVDYSTILRRATGQIQSGSSLPSSRQISSSLVKIVPEDKTLSQHSPYFTTEKGLQAAQASGKTLSEYFGLPINSEADVYSIYRTIPKSEVTVFTSHVAPTSELGGLVTRDGGAEQTLILNRNEWNDPIKIGTITNKGIMK